MKKDLVIYYYLRCIFVLFFLQNVYRTSKIYKLELEQVCTYSFFIFTTVL